MSCPDRYYVFPVLRNIIFNFIVALSSHSLCYIWMCAWCRIFIENGSQTSWCSVRRHTVNGRISVRGTYLIYWPWGWGAYFVSQVLLWISTSSVWKNCKTIKNYGKMMTTVSWSLVIWLPFGVHYTSISACSQSVFSKSLRPEKLHLRHQQDDSLGRVILS